VIRHVSKTRGFAIPTEESFLREIGPTGALYVGSPETVAQKIATNLTTLGATRFDLKYGMGGLSHAALMTNIELYGAQVIPRVRELTWRETRTPRGRKHCPTTVVVEAGATS
jgi:alkanesulfonate monooxygenase SsuD/methylene tetrahydromethanopterin reductase-like flavin-dependent oxidoreductase (luciferase family)